MMELDLNSANMLVELLKKRCSVYGQVASVEVHRQPSPFALVEMSRRDQAEKVASQYQGSIFGSGALVRLKHKDD